MAVCLKCEHVIAKMDDKNPKISCHGCERQVCVKCSGLLTTELRVIGLQSPTLKYLCPECTLGVRQLPALRKLVSEMRHEIEALKTAQGNRADLETIISEISDRKKRSKNVIMFGVPESPPDVDSETRRKQDQESVKEALANITQSESPIAVLRLGKQLNQAPRPLKLVFSSRTQAVRILKNARNLHRGIKIKNDLTPYQREYLIKLREELDERTKRGESNLTIKYVNNAPKIIQQKMFRSND